MSACEHYQQQISQLLDGELPPEQVQTLRAHLRTCPECQRVYDGFLALQAAVRDAAAAPARPRKGPGPPAVRLPCCRSRSWRRVSR